MKKAVQRLFYLMTAVVLILQSQTVLAAPDEERVAVYVQVPSDWESPCVWAWDESGNNAFASWPGGETEADAANEGWYYTHIPVWANHVIINANAGSIQTDELILEGGNVWITVNAPDSAEVSYEQQTDGEIPEYVEKFEIHARVDASWEEPHLWAWSAPDGTNAFAAWPGAEMKAEENGWYTAKAPVWVNSIIVNANEGGIQTEDISIDPAEIWVMVEADGSYDFSYVDPDAEEIPDITIHVTAPADWESPCLWAWSAPDGTNVFTTWPGEALEAGEDGWLIKEIPGWVNSVIVNGNDGSVQTTDISVESGRDIWLVVNGSEEFTVTYEKPEDAAVNQPVNADNDTAENDNADSQAAPPAEADADATVQQQGSNTVVIVIIVIAVVAVITAAVVVVKKKSAAK